MRLTRIACALTLGLLAPALYAAEAENPLNDLTGTWASLRASVVPEDTDPPMDAARFDLHAPPRAADPAIVAVRMVQGTDQPPLTQATVVIDENPAPVAAVFDLGPDLAPLDMEIRVRVNAYSNVRAVGGLADGTRLMAGRFVKAAGGCSAPASKGGADQMGAMKWAATPLPNGRTQGKLMIRHPNNSGLQRDQVTLLDIPAHFIDRLEVTQGDALLWRMEAGISISENPVFTFSYRPNGQPVTVHAEDTEGNRWDQTFAPGG